MTEFATLRVLYLGPDPKSAAAPRSSLDPDKAEALVRKRPASFEHLLRQHFETVTITTPDDYDESMSAAYDVTIFDACPKPIGKRLVQNSEIPVLLSDDFDHPSIMIAANTWRMIGRVGSNYKLDHL